MAGAQVMSGAYSGAVRPAPPPPYTLEGTYGNPRSLSRRFRAERFAYVRPLIERVIRTKGRCRIADIGGTEYYWDIFADYVATRPVEIDLINLKPEAVTPGRFNVVVGDATDLGHIDDNAYDLVHTNSVIEHVGDWAQMRRMAGHVRRLAPSYFVQTPSYWFPYEPHFRAPFFHWLPEQVRCRLLMSLNLGFGGRHATLDSAMRAVQSSRLIDRRQLAELFPDATIARERVAGLTKSLMAIRA
jgi:hypothetical protein